MEKRSLEKKYQCTNCGKKVNRLYLNVRFPNSMFCVDCYLKSMEVPNNIQQPLKYKTI